MNMDFKDIELKLGFVSNMRAKLEINTKWALRKFQPFIVTNIEKFWPHVDEKIIEKIDDYIMAPGWNKNSLGVILGKDFKDKFPEDGHVIQSKVKDFTCGTPLRDT